MRDDGFSRAQADYEGRLPEDNSHQVEQAEEAILEDLWANMDNEATEEFVIWLGPELIKKGISLDKMMLEWVHGTEKGRKWLDEAVSQRIEERERYLEGGPEHDD